MYRFQRAQTNLNISLLKASSNFKFSIREIFKFIHILYIQKEIYFYILVENFKELEVIMKNNKFSETVNCEHAVGYGAAASSLEAALEAASALTIFYSCLFFLIIFIISCIICQGFIIKKGKLLFFLFKISRFESTLMVYLIYVRI